MLTLYMGNSAVTELFIAFQHSFESLFRSQHYALLDNCCREYIFISDFFMVSGSAAQDLFNSIMGKTVSHFMVNATQVEA